MKRLNYKIAALVLVMAISMVTVLAVAVKYRKRTSPKTAEKKQQPAHAEPKKVYDLKLLKQFVQLAQQIDFKKPHCTYAGVINVIDGKDSTNTVLGIKFLFCKDNDNFYYRIGKTETIHERGLNVFIQHEQNQVVVSRQAVTLKSPVTGLQAIQKYLRYEDYALVSKKVKGRNKMLSLVNDTHITCKELSVTYDTISNRLKGIYARMSDFDDPLNKKKDRIIEVNVTKLEDKADLAAYPRVDEVLSESGGKWKLKPEYSKYELIKL